jgi:hypothetical protein
MKHFVFIISFIFLLAIPSLCADDYASYTPSEEMWADIHGGNSFQGDYGGGGAMYRDGEGDDDDLPPGGGSGGGGGVGTIPLGDLTAGNILLLVTLAALVAAKQKGMKRGKEMLPANCADPASPK